LLSEVSGELAENSGWHGSVKPLKVVADICQRISKPGQIVFDPFSGSGTTLIACEQLGRKCRACEIDEGYVAVALQRWSDVTGKTPSLLS
jgi:DNA modification methylase